MDVWTGRLDERRLGPVASWPNVRCDNGMAYLVREQERGAWGGVDAIGLGCKSHNRVPASCAALRI